MEAGEGVEDAAADGALTVAETGDGAAAAAAAGVG